MASSTSDKNLDCEKFNMAELRSIEFLACGRISMRQADPFRHKGGGLSVEECTDRTGRVAHYEVGNDRPDSSFLILQKGVSSPKSKFTVRQVALLANLRIHTDAVRFVTIFTINT
jgi:hypothetical protein